MHAVHAPVPKITVKGEEQVDHFQGVPFFDIGAEATVPYEDGTAMPVPVYTKVNTVPPGCETLGQYEIEYEAFAPGCDCCGCQTKDSPPNGTRVAARRIVEIGNRSSFIACPND